MIGWFVLSSLCLYISSYVVSILRCRVRVANCFLARLSTSNPRPILSNNISRSINRCEHSWVQCERHWYSQHSEVASLPGGRSAAAICIPAGWMMGKVHDIYLQYLKAGNMFIGRCLALLPLLSAKFAVSPPHFLNEVPKEWQADKKNLVFPFVSVLGGVSWLLEMCLVQVLVFHKDLIMNWNILTAGWMAWWVWGIVV
jgi:hypothetical protein